MLNLICKIEIRSKDTNKVVSFDYVNSIEVKTSMKNLTDTAIVKVPRKMQWREKSLSDFIRIGDSVSIETGYKEYGLQTIFKGYLTGIENGNPLVLSCENEMWKLKKEINVQQETIDSFDFKQFFEKYVKNVKCEIIGKVSFNSMNFDKEMTMAQAIDAVMKEYSYTECFFKNDVFYVLQKSLDQVENNLNLLLLAGKNPIVFDPTRNMITPPNY